MKFDQLDSKMRVFETAHDHCALPDLFLVARLDGRNFTRLTKEIIQFEAPYDKTFRNYMLETACHLMDCGFRVVYAYTQSDEISLLFHPEENTFGRKLRKYNSILSGEASAKFSLLLGEQAVFDCRISLLPGLEDVVDYFRWRSEDAHRNSLNAHCYWTLRRKGESAEKATKLLEGLSVADKNELLFSQANVNFNDLPNWQKRGMGLYWENVEKEAWNPYKNEPATTTRRVIRKDLDLPMREAYSQFVKQLIVNQYN